MNDVTELIDLASICGVCSTHMARATNNMLSERTIQRMIKTKNQPRSPLHRIVIGDILVALRYAYARKTLPVRLPLPAAETPQQRAKTHKAAVVAIIEEALYESRKILESGR